MGIKSINWWLDIQEYEKGTLYNSFSAGPIARSWDDAGGSATMTIQELVDEINDLFEEAWDNGDGDTENLYEVKPHLMPSSESYSTTGRAQATIRFEFVRSYPIYEPEVASKKKFKIALRSGPHGYKTFQPREPTYPAATITYTNQSDIKAATLPYWSANTMITDRPPIAPDVVFVPFLGISNKILLLLDGNMGDLDLFPIMIKDADVEFVAEELLSQLEVSVEEQNVRNYLTTNSVELNYRSDDPIKRYEVFRITKKPTSYDDFNTVDNPLSTIEEFIAPDKPSAPATYISTIRPNIKYYYCVRGIDVHNNISNPTEVFEIEMVDNNGQIFYTLKVVDLDEVPPKKYKKMGRRFIYIAPALQQIVFDRETFNDSKEINNEPQNIKMTDLPPSNMLGYLGENGNSVWDKKFKVRVTSAKTGKKFDLNITVKNSGVTNP
jgi:hypothetical protein